MKSPSPEELARARAVAQAVCNAAGEPERLEAVLSPNRATPRDARLRWICGFLYAEVYGDNRATVARAFQRNNSWPRWALRHLVELYRTNPEYNDITFIARKALIA